MTKTTPASFAENKMIHCHTTTLNNDIDVVLNTIREKSIHTNNSYNKYNNNTKQHNKATTTDHSILQSNNPMQRRSYQEHKKSKIENSKIGGIPSTVHFNNANKQDRTYFSTDNNDDDNLSFISALTINEEFFSHYHHKGNGNNNKSPKGEESQHHSGNGVVLPQPPMEVYFCNKPSSKNISRMDELIANLAVNNNNTTRQPWTQSSLSISCSNTAPPSNVSRKNSCPTAAELSRISNYFPSSVDCA